jgi:hypothetical protein
MTKYVHDVAWKQGEIKESVRITFLSSLLNITFVKEIIIYSSGGE